LGLGKSYGKEIDHHFIPHYRLVWACLPSLGKWSTCSCTLWAVEHWLAKTPGICSCDDGQRQSRWLVQLYERSQHSENINMNLCSCRVITTTFKLRTLEILKSKTTLSSSRVKPRPALTFVLYLNVGHRTIGLIAPATGLGATLKAFLTLSWRRLFFRPGWLNHVLTYLCQSLWKWLLWIMLLCFGAMVLDYLDKYPGIGQDFHF
jgi:hypothetical protein